ncbi:MAG: NAD(P)/FAD-dependent oxidoreductase [Pseudomonadota bacterium]
MHTSDVIVLGGGAAGLMCAMRAGARGKRVVVLEGANKIGKKILMSGGGRCNFTNLFCDPDHFISKNPHFCKSALKRYTQWDFILLVEKHDIPYYEKTLGQLFCENSSKDIVTMLRRECEDAGVRIITECDIQDVSGDGPFKVTTGVGLFGAPAIVVATGGLSIPKMGATDFGYRLARQYGHSVLPTRAGLVPFTFTGALHEAMQTLSGVSLPATATANGPAFREGLLFTHRGLSGPAALQSSSYWQPGEALHLDLMPGADAADALASSKRASPAKKLGAVIAESMPRAVVNTLAPWLWDQLSDTRLGEITDARLKAIGEGINQWSIKPAATEGYRTAEVTLGGVDTDALSSQTMESRIQPGLYFIGEVVDVTGHLGGFNFQWAWSSGVAAADAISA